MDTEERALQGHLRRLRTIERPSDALRAYIDGVAALVRLNAEDITADGWRERWLSLDAINGERWYALTDEEQALVRAVDASG